MPARVLVLAIALATACGDPLDTTRQTVDPASFGAIAYTLACKRLAWSEDRADGGTIDVTGGKYRDFCRRGTSPPPDPYPSVSALHGERAELIAALDEGFPEEDLPDLQALLSSNAFLTIYDDGTAEDAARAAAELLSDLAADDELTSALARLDGRLGYRPAEPAKGLLPAVARHGKLDDLLDVVPDALGPGGAAHAEMRNLELAVSRELATAAPAGTAPADPERTLNLAISLLLTEHPLLAGERPRLLVRRDHRGVPVVEKDGAAFPAPFVDRNTDGLADVDAAGDFLDANGQIVAVPAPFLVPWLDDTAARRDAAGRALTAAGRPLYRTFDVDRTLLGALGREARELFNPSRGTGLNLVRGASTLLGPRRSVTRTYTGADAIEFRGYDPAGAALLDLAHGYLQLLAEPAIGDALEVTRALLVDHEPVAARLLEALLATSDLGRQYPGARLEPGSALYDDLVPVVNEILAHPGLAEDILAALEDPAMRNLGKRFADLMTYRDEIDYNAVTQAVVGSMRTEVDRDEADSGFNRSILQRILHLIHDSAGHRLCSREGAIITFSGFPVSLPHAECELLRIDDLAVFYVQSIAYAKDSSGRVLHDAQGRPLPKARLPIDLPGYLEPFVTDAMMEDQSTIDGFRFHPTPQALNRVLFLSPPPGFVSDVMDPAVCKDGDRYQAQHSGSLAALELGGMYDAIRPLVQAFADHDREDLFVRVLVVLHTHWPSRRSLQHQGTNPQGHGYAKRSDVHAWEPLVAHVLREDQLWSALTSGAPAINAIRTASGRGAPEVLVEKARHVFQPRPGLAKRSGATTSTTEDGRPIPVLSPYILLADAYEAKRAQLAAAGPEGELWQSGTSQLLDQLARGEAAGATWRYRNPRLRGIAAAVIDFTAARIARHRALGDLDRWLARELPADLERVLTGPVFAGAADLALSLSAAPEARAAIEELVVFLHTDAAAMDVSLTVAADLLQWYASDTDLLPITRRAGRALDPEKGLLDATFRLVARARDADGGGALASLLLRLESDFVPGRTVLAQISDSISEVHRGRPFLDQGEPLTGGDYRRVMQAVATFLTDEKRGLMKFTEIVASRGNR
jgi:hypothetical protein